MNTLLTKEQIKDIRHMQKNLDIRVREANDIDMDKDLFEFANDVEAYKYWK